MQKSPALCKPGSTPWAWAILHPGKRIENRSWKTAYRGPLLIHASRTLLGEDLDELERVARRLRLPMPDPRTLPRQAIVGRAILVDVVEDHGSPWFQGPYGLVLSAVEPLADPIPMSGHQKLWNPSF